MKPENESNEFHRSFKSPNGIISFLFIAVCFTISVTSILEKDVDGILFAFVALFVIMNYSNLSKKIIVDEMDFKLDSKTIEWNMIEKVEFKLAGVRDFTNQVIEIYLLDKNSIIIKPRYYSKHVAFRKLFEEMVNKKDIKKQVEDRGI